MSRQRLLDVAPGRGGSRAGLGGRAQQLGVSDGPAEGRPGPLRLEDGPGLFLWTLKHVRAQEAGGG